MPRVVVTVVIQQDEETSERGRLKDSNNVDDYCVVMVVVAETLFMVK